MRRKRDIKWRKSTRKARKSEHKVAEDALHLIRKGVQGELVSETSKGSHVSEAEGFRSPLDLSKRHRGPVNFRESKSSGVRIGDGSRSA